MEQHEQNFGIRQAVASLQQGFMGALDHASYEQFHLPHLIRAVHSSEPSRVRMDKRQLISTEGTIRRSSVSQRQFDKLLRNRIHFQRPESGMAVDVTCGADEGVDEERHHAVYDASNSTVSWISRLSRLQVSIRRGKLIFALSVDMLWPSIVKN